MLKRSKQPDQAVYDRLFTGLGTTWTNEMDFGMNHALGAGLITRPVDLQSSTLLLCYGCLQWARWQNSAACSMAAMILPCTLWMEWLDFLDDDREWCVVSGVLASPGATLSWLVGVVTATDGWLDADVDPSDGCDAVNCCVSTWYCLVYYRHRVLFCVLQRQGTALVLLWQDTGRKNFRS